MKPRGTIATLIIVGTLCAVLVPSAGAQPTAEIAGCGTLTVDGRYFVFSKGGLTCKKAKGLARQTYRTNKPPPGWKCPDASPGNNRRDGGQCYKPGTDKFYGYHAFD